MNAVVARRLKYIEKDQIQTVTQDEALTLAGPLVILGDPGLGKSTLAEAYGDLPEYAYVRAGTFSRAPDPSVFLGNKKTLVIDGLDEIASAVAGGGVDVVLAKLAAMGHPPFILSCREADWRGAADRIKIEDDYGYEPKLLHLEPFDRNDATLFLKDRFPAIDAEAFLDHFERHGLDAFFENPLTLRLVAELGNDISALPTTKAELFDRACVLIVEEDNKRHQDGSHAKAAVGDLMLAAGAASAALLLGNLDGIFTGAIKETPDGYCHISAIKALKGGDKIGEALKTRLFKADGEMRFMPIHRVLAEYLAGKWLADGFQKGVSKRRILGLFHSGDSIPTSLRGLHAWLGYFGGALAAECIAKDPYGILLHSDAETLPLNLAREVFDALASLEKSDPYFRAGQWGRSPARGLLRQGMEDRVRSAIMSPAVISQFRGLLMEAMPETAVSNLLKPELRALVVDPERPEYLREQAVEAMVGQIDQTEFLTLLDDLMNIGDRNSARVAFGLMRDVGIAGVPPALVAQIIAAYLGLTLANSSGPEERHTLIMPPRGLLQAPGADLDPVLDELALYWPFYKAGTHDARSTFADIMLSGIIERLQKAPCPDLGHLWSWIGKVRSHEVYGKDKFEKVDAALASAGVRLSLIKHVLFSAPAGKVFREWARLNDCGLDLRPSAPELAQLITDFSIEEAGSPDYKDRLMDLIGLGRSVDGLAADVKAAAKAAAGGDAQILAFIRKSAASTRADIERRQKRNEAKRQIEIAGQFAAVRKRVSDDLKKTGAVNRSELRNLAFLYLGFWSEVTETDPIARMTKVLGPLTDQVLQQFRGQLTETGMPSASDIAAKHAEGKQFLIELPLICGVAEELRNGVALNVHSRTRLEEAMMAAERMIDGESGVGPEVRRALEAELLTSDTDIEAFFRHSIEPQLKAKCTTVDGLYRFMHDDRWPQTAGKLALDWLSTYPDIPATVLSDLIDHAIRLTDPVNLAGIAQKVRAAPGTLPADIDLIWSSVEFLVDFEATVADHVALATANRDYLWYLRGRLGEERRGKKTDFSLSQAAFIIQHFSVAWPYLERPSTTTGDANPWDAASFIESLIVGLSNDPSPAASDKFDQLISVVDPSYGPLLLHYSSLQRRLRRDTEFIAILPDQLRAVIDDQLPANVDDLKAFFCDRLDELQAKLKGSDTDRYVVYWDGQKPHQENYCRDRLIEDISANLPEAIRFTPEADMPDTKRADIAAVFNQMGLPVEIKGQWHPEIWTAPTEQLAARYLRDWRSDGRGVYIVLWFGNVPGKQLTAHPDGLAAPSTPEEMRKMLIDRLPVELRPFVDVRVIEVPQLPKRPAAPAPKKGAKATAVA